MNTERIFSNGFLSIAGWLKITWTHGRGCANLWIYLVTGIVLCGGAGFWLLALKTKLNLDTPDLLLTFCSYTPAVAGASCMDFIFGEDERRYLRGFAILFGAFVLVLTLCAFFSESYWCAGLSTLLSLSLWWLANAENPKLFDIATPLSAVGGNTDGAVQGSDGGIKL